MFSMDSVWKLWALVQCIYQNKCKSCVSISKNVFQMCEGISVSVSVSLSSAHRQLFDCLKLGLMKGLVCGRVNTELCSKILYREIRRHGAPLQQDLHRQRFQEYLRRRCSGRRRWVSAAGQESLHRWHIIIIINYRKPPLRSYESFKMLSMTLKEVSRVFVFSYLCSNISLYHQRGENRTMF